MTDIVFYNMVYKTKKMFKIQHSKTHLKILKTMETLDNMTFSIVIMASSDYSPDNIN